MAAGMVGLAPSQLGSSRLTGGIARSQSLTSMPQRGMPADVLLASGPRGGPGSFEALRHSKLLASRDRLLGAAERAVESPLALYSTIKAEERKDSSAEALAQARGRLARVVLDQVQRRLQLTTVEKPTTDLRSRRLRKLRAEMDTARSCLDSRHAPAAREEFRRFEAETEALVAIERALQLQQEVHELLASLTAPAAPSPLASPSAGGSSSRLLPPLLGRSSSAAGGLLAASATMSRPSSSSALGARRATTPLAPEPASPTGAAASAASGEESDAEDVAFTRRRGRLVGEAMQMLSKWKGHSEVAFHLCGALLAMAEPGSAGFKEELDRRGLSVLASVVADLWTSKPKVCRVALRLLSTVAIEGVLSFIENQAHNEVVVSTGLEVLCRRARDRGAADSIVECGGREVLDILLEKWKSHKTLPLQAINLRRHLQKSRAKSLRKVREVRLPPEDIIRLRGCWCSLVEDHIECISQQQLETAFKLLGIKMSDEELQEALQEVDVDADGSLGWSEFIWLMSKFGKGQSIENQFTDHRLAELREVFNMFDTDGSGTLDTAELGAVMRKVGLEVTERDIHAMIQRVDADTSGSIDWPEFLFLMSKKVVDPEAPHRLGFRFFDRAGRGRILRTDFVTMMRKLSADFTAEELEQMFRQAKFEDSDHTSMTYREFVKMMMRQ